MPDPAVVATGSGVLATVVASVASYLDIRSLKARVDDLVEKVIPALTKRIDEVAAAIDPKLRGDLNALSARVTRYRNEPTTPTGVQRNPTGSFPQVDDRSAEALSALARRLDDLNMALSSAVMRIAANEKGLSEMAEMASATRDTVIEVKTIVTMLREQQARDAQRGPR